MAVSPSGITGLTTTVSLAAQPEEDCTVSEVVSQLQRRQHLELDGSLPRISVGQSSESDLIVNRHRPVQILEGSPRSNPLTDTAVEA